MLGRRVTGIACAVALLAASPADGSHREDPDGEGVVVAGPMGDERGTRLSVRGEGRELCLSLEGEDSGGESLGGGACGALPPRDLYGPYSLKVFLPAPQRPEAAPLRARPAQVERLDGGTAGGAVRANVHFVEVELARRQRVRIPTIPAPPALAGEPAGELRFFLGTLPGAGDPHAFRMLDAAGGLIAEEDISGEGGERPPLLPPRVIASGRDVRDRWRITATIERRLAPARGDVARRQRVLCLRHRRYESESGSRRSSSCVKAPPDDAVIDSSGSCDPQSRTVLYGVGPAAEVPRTAVLGDGRRVGLRPRALPRAFRVGDTVAFAQRMPAGSAVRAVIDRDGRSSAIGLPPPALTPCGSFGAFFEDDDPDDVGRPGPGGDVDVGAPGAPSLFVRDTEDQELCLAVGRPAHSEECGTPGPWLAETLLDVSRDRRSAGGAVDPEVAAVRVRVDDGSVFDVATHAGEAYAGRYAGRMRFFTAGAPRGRRIARLELLDAAGATIVDDAYEDVMLARDARPFVRAHGVTVAVAPALASSNLGGQSCVTITSGALPRAGDDCADVLPPPRILHGAVACTPRAAVAVVGLTPGSRGATATLGDGTRVRLAVRRGPASERVAILVAPPGRAVRSIVVHARGGVVRDRFRVPVPPARRQCGYGFFGFGAFGDGQS